MRGLMVGDDFDVHNRGFRQGSDLDGGARRKIRREIFGVNFVHPREVGEVGQKHGAFHNVGKRQLLVVENGFDVLEHAVCLCLDVALDEIARGGINRNLSRAKQQVANAHGMVIGTNGWGGFSGYDDSFCRHKSVILARMKPESALAAKPQSKYPQVRFKNRKCARSLSYGPEIVGEFYPDGLLASPGRRGSNLVWSGSVA